MVYEAGKKYVCECKSVNDEAEGKVIYFEPLGELTEGVDQYAYNKGMEAAYMMLYKITEMTGNDRAECFAEIGHGTGELWDVFEHETVQGVKKALDAWENKICYGDEVTPISEHSPNGGKLGIAVGLVETSKKVRILWEDGTASKMQKQFLRRTGNNYAAELQQLIGKIGGGRE